MATKRKHKTPSRPPGAREATSPAEADEPEAEADEPKAEADEPKVAAEGQPARGRSPRVWLLAIAFICAIGIVVGIDLTRVYVLTNTDPEFVSFCAINESVNCSTVAASPYATAFGVINSVWAIFAYLWLGALAVWGAIVRSRDSWPQGIILGVSSLLLAASLVLLYVMEFLIGSLCVLCLALDVVNVALFVIAVVLWRSSSADRKPLSLLTDDVRWFMRRPLALGGVLVVTLALLAIAIQYSSRVEARVAAATPVWSARKGGGKIGIGPDGTLSLPSHGHGPSCEEPGCPCQEGDGGTEQPTVHLGRDERGHQWIGAPKPKVTIEEFTDYECPFCRKAHLQVRAALARNSSSVRVVHRHYPLDQDCNSALKRPFHQHACMLSRVAHCAGEQGRFWEMNDYLFQHAPSIRRKQPSAVELAGQLELDLEKFECCMRSADTEEHLRQDIEAGQDLGIKGTPAFVIEGKVHYGVLPDDLLTDLLER